MAKQTLKDIIVVLPGILGSVLKKNGNDLWISGTSALSNVVAARSWNTELPLTSDSGKPEAADDGVEAVGILKGIGIVPGFWKWDGLGYTRLLQAIEENFKTVRALPGENKLANVIEFPYDWRRDNRYTAQWLCHTVTKFLEQWREKNKNKDAKVIFIAHSMGGLVARYYLDVLGGWQDCRALITLGTPFRGSPLAAGALANGNRILGIIDVSDALRTMDSPYQLLPRYRFVLNTNEYHSMSELQDLPNIDASRINRAMEFHQEIDQAVLNRQGKLGYPIYPFAGIGQSTDQSLVYRDGKLSLSGDRPRDIPDAFYDGDSIVPLVSAIPREMNTEAEKVFYINEKHGSLQGNDIVLNNLTKMLLAMEVSGLEALLGSVAHERSPALSLEVKDLYNFGETVQVKVQVAQTAVVEKIFLHLGGENGIRILRQQMHREGNGWICLLPNLQSGAYWVEAKTVTSQGEASARDVFAIAEA